MDGLSQNAIKYINQAKEIFNGKELSIISQQCIGAVIYHDMGMKFLSPTVNLYLEAKDFIQMVEDLETYMSLPIKVKKENDLIVGELDKLRVIFLHYHTIEEAKTKWEERKSRIIWDKIFIICTDRDGFDEECFEKFKKLKYPKALITRNPDWKDEDFCVYLEKYSNFDHIPDTVGTREFYEKNKIIELLNKAYEEGK